MHDLPKLQDIVTKNNIIFYKLHCNFCDSSKMLLDMLVEAGIIDKYHALLVGEDYDERDLTELVKIYGWEPDGYQLIATKPQIFLGGGYVGGNSELYQSKWNLGDNGSGILKTGDKEYKTPQKRNPRGF